MSDRRRRKGSGIGVLDTVLVVAGVIGGILVLLWALRVVAGLVLFAFKLAVVVVVVVVIIRLVHLFSRSRRLSAPASRRPSATRRRLSLRPAPRRARRARPPCARWRSSPRPPPGSPGDGARRAVRRPPPWRLVVTQEAGHAVVDHLGSGPSGKASTGVPQAMASSMTIPKGSFHRMGNSRARAFASNSSLRSWGTSPR